MLVSRDAVLFPHNCYTHRQPVTELLGTDLHRLLTSRPLEKQFIQYFLYQILVRTNRTRRTIHHSNLYSAV